MRLSFIILLLYLFTAGSAYGQDTILARDPALSPDGNTVTFSFQGDIWTVPFAGGEAERLTVHQAYEHSPRWSPDGKEIAFSGNRFGNDDIFTIPAEGGRSKRITYYSGGDGLSDWTSTDKLLFSSNRVFRQIEWDSELQQVSAKGGTPSLLMDAVGGMPAMSPNGRFIALVRGSCRISREQYNGPADKEIWIYDTQNKSFSQLTDNSVNDYLPRWGDNQRLYYIGAESGRYNIYSQALTADGTAQGSPQQITNFKEDGVRYFDVDAGHHIVFERKTDLYTINGDGASPKKLAISLSSDYRFDPIEHRVYTNNLSGYEVSPNGKYTALTIRGEVFVMDNDKENRRTVDLSNHAWRDQSPTWLNDSTLIFSSDRDGQYDLYMVRSSDPNKTDILKSLKHEIVRLTQTPEDESNPKVSPDGKKIVFQRGRGQLITANINSDGKMSARKTLLDGWASPEGVAWSPDSKWLAYSLDNLNFNSEVYIQAADASDEPVNVSMHPRGDSSPVWSPDGSKLGFLSNRNNGDMDIWFVWLKKEDWQKTKKDREEGYYFDTEEKSAKKEGKDEKDKKEVSPVEIDFDGIYERLSQVTSRPGDEGNLVISADGETFYYTAGAPVAGGRDLYSIRFDRTKSKRLSEGGKNPYGVTLGPDGKNLYAIRRGSLYKVDSKKGSFTNLPFRAAMAINHTKENRQIFEEAWSTLNQGFYDPNFHGYNWDALKKKYRPMVLSASTSQDFQYMFNWMLGQLNASHMGLYGQNPEDTQNERTGLLGIGVEPVKDGVRVTKVVMNSPADKERSRLYPGDIITKINGEPLSPDTNFYSYLVNNATEQVLMEVRGKDGKSREVVIRPTNSLSNELYNEWVHSRKELTQKYSNGRLGYIHIRGMNWPSFEHFERELMASGHGKEGIVIDVRWNGGGWTTDYLMAVLNVKQHSYTIPRGATGNLQKDHKKFRDYYPFSERLPLSWWTKPSVAMANESSYSNAEIFSHAYKTLGIGKLVGMPTFGAVISTGGKGLINGSFVRLPFRAWYVKATDENMEHGPAVPDVEVNNAPDSKASGEDPQLKKAVEVLLNQIDSGN